MRSNCSNSLYSTGRGVKSHVSLGEIQEQQQEAHMHRPCGLGPADPASLLPCRLLLTGETTWVVWVRGFGVWGVRVGFGFGVWGFREGLGQATLKLLLSNRGDEPNERPLEAIRLGIRPCVKSLRSSCTELYPHGVVSPEFEHALETPQLYSVLFRLVTSPPSAMEGMWPCKLTRITPHFLNVVFLKWVLDQHNVGHRPSLGR